MCKRAVFVAVRHGARVSFHGRCREGLMRLRNAPGLRGEPRPPWRPLSGPGPGAALGATRSALRTARRTGAMAGAAGPRGALWDGHVVRAGSRAGLPQWAGRRRCSALSLPTSVSARSSRSVRFNAPAGSFLSVVAPQTANWVVSPVASLSSLICSFICCFIYSLYMFDLFFLTFFDTFTTYSYSIGYFC